MKSTTIIIFGATGDLTCRKLIPALYRMIKKDSNQKFLIVGAAWDDVSTEDIIKKCEQYIRDPDPHILKQLKDSFYYHQLDFLVGPDYATLQTKVTQLEKTHGMSGNRLLYLATAARFFCPITEYASQSGLAERKCKDDPVWNRLAYEKPFGHDLKSAHQINKCIENYFAEHQIYRVDHFLTKELVGNISLIRFTNIVFEPLWNHSFIENVQIVLSEELGIESRGGYYDSYGALADVAQNHMLELMALIAMEAPKKLSGEFIREQRTAVLEKVQVVDAILGQYEGYKQEKTVKPDSKTETFAALCLTINNDRWKGVPFFLKTGKKLDKKETVIRIKFRNIDCLLDQDYCPSDSNYLIIQVTPDAGFSLILNAKKPAKAFEVSPVKMEFCHSCMFGTKVPDAYETLFEEIMKGELSTSVGLKEIEAAWKIIDTVRAMNAKVHSYEKGSRGPDEAMKQFSKSHKIGWKL